jgi:hypothetical protein
MRTAEWSGSALGSGSGAPVIVELIRLYILFAAVGVLENADASEDPNPRSRTRMSCEELEEE